MRFQLPCGFRPIVRGARSLGTDRIEKSKPPGCAINRVPADGAGGCALVIGTFIHAKTKRQERNRFPFAGGLRTRSP